MRVGILVPQLMLVQKLIPIKIHVADCVLDILFRLDIVFFGPSKFKYFVRLTIT